MMLTLVLLSALFLLAGILALARGLYGVAIDDHPLCRHCGFDLTGRPAGVNVCSECGADPTRPHAMRIGHRRRRSGLVATGAALLAIVLAVGGGATWVAMSSANWRVYAPAWWLLREADGLDPVARDAAVAELGARMTTSKLSQADIDRMMDQTLAMQADANRQWIPAWGDLLESAHSANKLSAERWQKYLVQAINLRLEVRPEIRRGDRLTYWIHSGKSRVGTRSVFYAHSAAKGWEIGSVRRSEEYAGGSSGYRMEVNDTGATGSSVDLKKFIDQLKDGRQTIKDIMDIGISSGQQSNAPIMATTHLELATTFTLHPASQQTVTINHDPSFRAGVEKALTCTLVNLSPNSGQGGNASAYCTINVAHLPVGVGYDITVMVDGKEYKIGSFASPVNSRFGGYGSGGSLPLNTPAKVDLVLKPSIDAAIGTVDTFEIWDGQVVIKNVPVSGGTTAPTTVPTTVPTAAKPAEPPRKSE